MSGWRLVRFHGLLAIAGLLAVFIIGTLQISLQGGG